MTLFYFRNKPVCEQNILRPVAFRNANCVGRFGNYLLKIIFKKFCVGSVYSYRHYKVFKIIVSEKPSDHSSCGILLTESDRIFEVKEDAVCVKYRGVLNLSRRVSGYV